MSKSNVLITPTLLDSFNFVKNAPPSWQTKAMNDFVAKIRREKGTFPLWVKKGLEFEQAVYRICAGKTEDSEITVGSELIKELFTFLRKENLYDDYYHIFSNNRR